MSRPKGIHDAYEQKEQWIGLTFLMERGNPRFPPPRLREPAQTYERKPEDEMDFGGVA